MGDILRDLEGRKRRKNGKWVFYRDKGSQAQALSYLRLYQKS